MTQDNPPQRAQPCGLHLVLVAPEIPQNTGSIARMAAGTGAVLHLVEPLGFSLSDRYLKRAGLDYWPSVRLVVHPSFEEYLAEARPERLFLFHTRARTLYTDVSYRVGDHLVFGCESKGLPREILDAYPDSTLRIPSLPTIRSYNLSNSAGVALFEAIRSIGWDPGPHPGGYGPGKATIPWKQGKGPRVGD